MAYVYEHWRADTCEPFWVGKGSGGRANLKSRRNRYHAIIIKKLDGLGLPLWVRIVADNLTDEQAFVLEVERIAIWRARGVKLANASTGGRGGLTGCKRSPESRLKQSQTSTGRKLSEHHRQKIITRSSSPEGKARTSAIHLGRKRPPETGRKISEAKKKHWADPEIRERHVCGIRAAAKPVSEETRAKMRAAKTSEARARISAAAKAQWQNPEFRKLVSDTMRATNAKRKERRSSEQ